MRYSYLTPHQYDSLIPFIDTLLVTTHTTIPLDIAVPHGASQWIAAEIASQLKNRFQGRMADVTMGPALPVMGITPATLDATAIAYGYPLKCGMVITDRTLLTDSLHIVDCSDRNWVVVDWWQYFCLRTPTNRTSDLWMYLAQASGDYHTSHEGARLGLSKGLTEAMFKEGSRLIEHFVNWSAEQVVAMWQEA